MFKCSKPCIKDCIHQHVPVTEWLPKYKWKRYLLKDLASGLTVGVMHIPQGIAYAILARVPPMVGIYMGFFPVLVYFIFGTSRHLSLGSFAIVCLMTGDSVIAHNATGDDQDSRGESEYTALEVATAVTMMVGLYEILFFFLRFGTVCTILSETIISAFTAGAAIHVLASQVKNLLGISLERHVGLLSIIYTFADVFGVIQTTNLATLVVSIITMFVLTFEIIVLRPYLKRKCNIRLPMELLVLIIATTISSFTDINQKYGIKPVGKLYKGFPSPTFPRWELLGSTAVDSLFITLVAYSVSVSLALMYATSLQYQIDPNQEMLAHGLANILGSCFSCVTSAGSLARSSVQLETGGKTQLAGVVAAALLLVVMFWLGPFFEPLPRATLSGIIVIALRRMIMQITNLPTIWRISKLDGGIWLTLFLVVVVVHFVYGLLCGVILLIISVLIQNMKPPVYLVGRVPKQWNDTGDGGAYVDLRCPAATEIPGIKIVQIRGPVNFATWKHVQEQTEGLTGVCPRNVLMIKKSLQTMNTTDDDILQQEAELLTSAYRVKAAGSKPPVTSMVPLKLVVLDLTMVPFFDLAGVNGISSLSDSYNKINVQVSIVCWNRNLGSCHTTIEEALNEYETANNEVG